MILLTRQHDLQRLCTNFTTIVEIGAGILGKYGVRVHTSVDNKTWAGFPPDRYLDTVQQMDSLDYLHLHPEVELFILAWPEEDDLASRIWQTLCSGQHLLYIGEDRDGCTADSVFFELIDATKCEIMSLRK